MVMRNIYYLLCEFIKSLKRILIWYWLEYYFVAWAGAASSWAADRTELDPALPLPVENSKLRRVLFWISEVVAVLGMAWLPSLGGFLSIRPTLFLRTLLFQSVVLGSSSSFFPTQTQRNSPDHTGKPANLASKSTRVWRPWRAWSGWWTASSAPAPPSETTEEEATCPPSGSRSQPSPSSEARCCSSQFLSGPPSSHSSWWIYIIDNFFFSTTWI